MTLPVVRVLRKITVGAIPGMKFLIRPKRRKAIGFEELAKRMQAHSSLTKADAYAAMIQMQDEVLAELMEGNPVSLGKLGTLTPMFRAKAVDTLEEAIRNIDRETRQLLQETFALVNGHFGELFPLANKAFQSENTVKLFI